MDEDARVHIPSPPTTQDIPDAAIKKNPCFTEGSGEGQVFHFNIRGDYPLDAGMTRVSATSALFSADATVDCGCQVHIRGA